MVKKKYQKNFKPNATQIQFQATEAGVKLNRKSNKPKFMVEYDLTYEDLASAFGYKSAKSFHSSSIRETMLDGIEWIIRYVEEKKK